MRGERLVVARLSALALGLLIAGCSTKPPPEPPTTRSSLPRATTEPPRPTPTPVGSVVSVGPLDENGVPTSLEDEAVLRGSALQSAIAASKDATPLVAGGWFHAPRVVRYCALFRPDPAVDSCYAFGLYEHRVGGKPIWITRGDVADADEIAGAVDRPVVLRLHTHDPRCGDIRGCPDKPVLDAIAWLGDAPLESAPPRVIGTPPPGGISRDEAIERARNESVPHRTPLVLRSAEAGPIWTILPDLETREGDIWVWTVVFEADFVSPCDDCHESDTEEVFLDYLTGAFILARQ